ncbi:uncharacterized protein LOC107037573 [Diachasma alloeum]|uniref:uncharacterized protein LOC107037573 n=1 Tax=Diachasma alloeum TaxID=454923 RepID=UPI0007383EBC|nr:uncharacterized protein LOC107037573 [Diachasma alloeum]
MVKLVILVGLVLFSEIYGIPTTGHSPDDSPVSERPRADGWITFSPSWPFSSVSSLFRDNEPAENGMKLLKKRIENLEKSQKSIVETLRRITLSGVNSACNTKESPPSEKPILPSKNEEINNKKKIAVKPTSPLTSPVSTAIDHLPGGVDSTIPLKNSRVKTTVPVASENSIASTTPKSVKYERSTTPSGNEDNSQIVKVTGIDIPPGNQPSSGSNTDSVIFEDEKNPKEFPSSSTSQLGSIRGLATPESAKLNTKFVWSPEINDEKI